MEYNGEMPLEADKRSGVNCGLGEYNGEIRLEIGRRDNGESYMEKQYYKLPLQVMTPFYQDRDGTCFLYLLNPSGGVLDYDNFKIEVRVKDGAKACISTPSATKIYKKRRKEAPAAQQENVFYLGSGSVLEYCPDEIIPYADSAFLQENRFYLEEDSTLITWDILSGGRALRGEVFRFEQYTSRTDIYVNQVPLVIDKMTLKPQEVNVANLQCMREYLYTATVYAYGADCTEELVETLVKEGTGYEDGLSGASLVTEKLIAVKILGSHAYRVLEEVQRVWEILRQGMLDKKAVRLRKF